MLFPSSATIAILLDLVENELGSLTLVSAGDRRRLANCSAVATR